MDADILLELFPKKEIKINEKVIAIVKPIAIEDYIKVTHIIKNLVRQVQSGVAYESLAFDMIDDIIELVPYSVDTELPKLPGTILPEVIQAMIELNLTKSIVKNWSDLFKMVGEKLPEILEKKEAGQDSGKQ